jgi:predicted NUDIX family NTP pyrophosphohydrolase
MRKSSAGVMLYRFRDGEIEVLLAHPGGPLWKNRDLGAWTIPKGVIEAGDEPLPTALRELEEETGLKPIGEPVSLGVVVQLGGKRVYGFALNQDFDPATLTSNTFKLEWPPRSGRLQDFPEIDRAEWFDPETAKVKIIEAQRQFVDRLLELLGD